METRDGNTGHIRQRTDITPPSQKARVGLGTLEAPRDTHTDRIQDGDLQSGTDRWRPRGVVFVALALSALPPQTEFYYPPQNKLMGQLGGIRSPPGLNTQDRTTCRARQTGEDRTAHRNRQPSWAKLGC